MTGAISAIDFQQLSGTVMDNEFCQAIIENNRAALKTLVDRVLDNIGGKGNLDEQIAELKAWIEQHECIAEVVILPDLLDTEPPIQELILTLKSEAGGSNRRSLGIRLLPDKLLFDYK